MRVARFHTIIHCRSPLKSIICTWRHFPTFLMSVLTESIHVFVGLPRLRTPGTSICRALLIGPSLLSTCPYQRSLLWDRTLVIEGIISLSSKVADLTWSNHFILHIQRIMLRSHFYNLAVSETVGAHYWLQMPKIWLWQRNKQGWKSRVSPKILGK